MANPISMTSKKKSPKYGHKPKLEAASRNRRKDMPRRQNRPKKELDDDQDLREQNRKLKEKIRKMEVENRKLRSEKSTAMDAWEKARQNLDFLNSDKDINQIIDHEKTKKKSKNENCCEQCGNDTIRIMQMSSFKILICSSCEYRIKK